MGPASPPIWCGSLPGPDGLHGRTTPMAQFHELPALRVAVLGAGTVGTEVLRLIDEQGEDLAHRVGARLEVTGVAVRDLSRDRRPNVPAELLTADASALVRQADLVIEVMGGIEPARSLLLEAMSHGASVVTANKALLAPRSEEHTSELQSRGHLVC